MKIHPQIIEKEGKKEYVVLPYEEFLALQEVLEEYQDLRELREARAQAASEEAVPLADIRDDLLRH